MDWSKAKNIIIAALIAANLFLGYTYFSQQTDLKAQARDSARYTAEYLELMGAQLNCSLPLEREKLPVVSNSPRSRRGRSCSGIRVRPSRA